MVLGSSPVAVSFWYARSQNTPGRKWNVYDLNKTDTNWFEFYLASWIFFLKAEIIACGVPEGSIVRAIFLWYLNDLSKSLKDTRSSQGNEREIKITNW